MRKRITIQEKFELIMECRNSGLSDYQWCKQHGLSPSTFYGYVKQVRKHNCVLVKLFGNTLFGNYAPYRTSIGVI